MEHLKEHPAHIEAKGKLDRLNAAFAKVDGRIAEIDLQLASAQPTPGAADDRFVGAALKFAESGEVVKSSAIVTSLTEERAELQPQRSALTRAILAASDELEHAARNVSAGVCKTLKAQHQQIVRKRVNALRQLHAIECEERAFLAEVRAHGYEPRFEDTFATARQHLGSLDERDSLLWRAERDAAWYADMDAYEGPGEPKPVRLQPRTA
ncbi:hypothetical protein [Aquabacterium sp.]|uniref:hypothetical protein n=1 Tax=Aquabacterium sp. TaxID=1872578 RepID=UPI0037843917